MPERPKLVDIESAILYELYDQFVSSSDTTTSNDLFGKIRPNVSERFFHSVIRNLVFNQKIRLPHVGDAHEYPDEVSQQQSIELTRSGVLSVELDTDGGIDAYVNSNGVWANRDQDSKMQIGLGMEVSAEVIPGTRGPSNDDWEPLPIDRAALVTQEMIDSFQLAYEDIRQSNGYAESYPEERNSVVNLMQSGLGWLKTETSIARLQFNFCIIEPLKKAKARFKDSAITVLITKALEKAYEWLTNLPGI